MKHGPYIRQPGQRRPFWLPASNYYVMAAAVSTAFFFLVWGILHDEHVETPWVTAGVGASIILGGAVILRELILRRARDRYLKTERRVAANFSEARAHLGDRRAAGKMTLEKNAAILKVIKQKSDAAKILNKVSAGHREVFELCDEYLSRNESELTTVNAASPRLAALLKGRNTASTFHRYHLLKWAEIEARMLTSQAGGLTDVDERLRAANDAINVIEFALESYPADENLLESRNALQEMSVSIRVSDLIEQAERSAFGKQNREAIGLYRDALFYLGRDNIESPERKAAADRITAEMDRLRLLEGGE